MSKIGNHRVEIQERGDYMFGWHSAERGEPKPMFTCISLDDMNKLQSQQLGWQDYHNQETTP